MTFEVNSLARKATVRVFIFAGPREARNPNLDSGQRIAYYACAPGL